LSSAPHASRARSRCWGWVAPHGLQTQSQGGAVDSAAAGGSVKKPQVEGSQRPGSAARLTARDRPTLRRDYDPLPVLADVLRGRQLRQYDALRRCDALRQNDALVDQVIDQPRYGLITRQLFQLSQQFIEPLERGPFEHCRDQTHQSLAHELSSARVTLTPTS
jgi:hypothetical protein